MSMSAVIAAVLVKHKTYVGNEDFGGVVCEECGWSVADKWPTADPTPVRLCQHEAHAIAKELAKAGYGKVQEAQVEAWSEGWAAGLLDASIAGRKESTNPYRAGETK